MIDPVAISSIVVPLTTILTMIIGAIKGAEKQKAEGLSEVNASREKLIAELREALRLAQAQFDDELSWTLQLRRHIATLEHQIIADGGDLPEFPQRIHQISP